LTRLFGTDGVRGRFGETLTAELAFALGAAAARHVRRVVGPALVARDTRASGVELGAAVAAGLESQGTEVVSLGVVPTPALSWLVPRRGARLGVMVSASHNPEPDNGIKFFEASGAKLSSADELAIEDAVGNGVPEVDPAFERWGKPPQTPDPPPGQVLTDYLDHLRRAYQGKVPPLRVVVDSANGACSGLAGPVMRSLGAEAIDIHDRPDGTNINHQAGSTDTRVLRRRVVEEGADLGLAFDGDGDRAVAVDERGLPVDGDHMLAIFALELQRAGALRGQTVVASVMSNLALEQLLAARGIQLVRTPVGDRHVLDAMLACGAVLGGEQSGHLIDLRLNHTGDGLLTALQLLAVMGADRRPLSELAAVLQPYPQVLKNVPVPSLLDGWRIDGALRSALQRVRGELGADGRVLVRPSGTEPVVRVMVEGRDWKRIGEMADELGAAISAQLPAAVA
jgi:phosphoglucosamine mutase